MSLEHKIQSYIKKEGWDLNYHNGKAYSFWGGEYTVVIDPQETCFSAFGSMSPFTKTITLRKPCSQYIDLTLAESSEEVMASVLAHEIGHADSHLSAIPMELGAFMVGLGLSKGFKSCLPIALTIPIILLGHVAYHEIAAEVCASYLHNSSFVERLYLNSPDFFKLF
jgi:hypothetical protein